MTGMCTSNCFGVYSCLDSIMYFGGPECTALTPYAIISCYSEARAAAVIASTHTEKAKVNAFMEGLADELHGTGVTAQAAVLGLVLTPGYQEIMVCCLLSHRVELSIACLHSLCVAATGGHQHATAGMATLSPSAGTQLQPQCACRTKKQSSGHLHLRRTQTQ